ncbi:MAG TPA: hypothetical protein VNZ67_10300, partial [bacterium]|nr:hypothetical protein [bacterium]
GFLALAAALDSGCVEVVPIGLALGAPAANAAIGAAMNAPFSPYKDPPEPEQHATKRRIHAWVGFAIGAVAGEFVAYGIDHQPQDGGTALGAVAGGLCGYLFALEWDHVNDPWPPPNFQATPPALAPAAPVLDLQSQVRAQPNSAPAWEDLGDAQVRSGQMGAALASYKQAPLLDPANPKLKYKVQALTPR